MLPPLNMPQIMQTFGLHSDKRLGQNFLIDENALLKVVSAADIAPGDCVLEIGAGIGNLTRYLALTAHRVVAVEIDQRLIPALHQVLNPFPNVSVVQGDILALNPAQLFPEIKNREYIVAANIPYYITSAVIRHLLEASIQPKRIALTIQREVAERVCANPGELSLLALSVQVYGKPEIASYIPAGAFLPAPKVDSAIVRIDLYAEPRLPATSLDTFFFMAKAGFSQKRKTLRNSLSAGLGISPQDARSLLENVGVDPQRRAESLSLEEWGKVVSEYQRRRG